MKMFIFSYYNPPTVTLEKIVFDRIEEKYDKYLICGDFNARSIALGGVGNYKNGEILEQIAIMSNGMVLNKGKDRTFIKTNSEYRELLDYLLGSAYFANKMSKFKVLKNSVLDSDHLPIQAEFELSNTIKKPCCLL